MQGERTQGPCWLLPLLLVFTRVFCFCFWASAFFNPLPEVGQPQLQVPSAGTALRDEELALEISVLVPGGERGAPTTG